MPIFAGPFVAGDDVTTPPVSYPSLFQKLLPPGAVWNFERDSKLRATLTAASEEFSRVATRGRDLVRESLPNTAADTLSEWETALGLPDEQVPVLPTNIDDRRAVITAKYVARGGQNYDYYEALCLAAGWPLSSIVKGAGRVLRVGGRVNDRVHGAAWGYSIELILSPPNPGALAQADFERLLRYATHSHIVVVFTYL